MLRTCVIVVRRAPVDTPHILWELGACTSQLPPSTPTLPIPHTDISPLSPPLRFRSLCRLCISMLSSCRSTIAPASPHPHPRRTSALASFLLALFELRCSLSHTPTLPSRDHTYSCSYFRFHPHSAAFELFVLFCIERRGTRRRRTPRLPTYYPHSCFRVERPAVERYLCTSIIITFYRRTVHMGRFGHKTNTAQSRSLIRGWWMLKSSLSVCFGVRG